MSPPEVWGPAVWTLFHTLIAKIDERAYPYISPQLFYMIVRICRFLPCPECSTDASNFLAKIKIITKFMLGAISFRTSLCIINPFLLSIIFILIGESICFINL